MSSVYCKDRMSKENVTTHKYASFTIMRRTYERGTKARLSFSDGLHTPANMADSMEEVHVGKRRKWHCGNVCYAIFHAPSFRKSLKFFGTFRQLPFGSRNLHSIRHVYRSIWTARKAKPRFAKWWRHTFMQAFIHLVSFGFIHSIIHSFIRSLKIEITSWLVTSLRAR